MYLEFVLILYGKMIDMETSALKGEFITYRCQEEGAHHTRQSHVGKHQGRSGADGAGGESTDQSLYPGFCRNEWARQDG